MAMRLGWFRQNHLSRTRPSRPFWRENIKINHCFSGRFHKNRGMGHFQKMILFKTMKFISPEFWETKSRFYRTKLKKKYIFESICYIRPLWFIIGKLRTLFSNEVNVRIYEKRIPIKFVRKCQKLSFLTAWSSIELKFNSFMMENRFWPKLLIFLW